MTRGGKKRTVFVILLLLISVLFVVAPSVLAADTTPPTVTVNFCGNHGDKGGPYYRPPGETATLSGANANGYYANNSYQSESWMYLNLTVTDDTAVSYVVLHWLNATTNKWFNTSRFVKKNTNYYEINTSVNITNITGGHKYSFDVWAVDTSSNVNKTCWNKTGIGGNIVRRYVHLGCTPTNISYTPFYCHLMPDYGADSNKYDRLPFDQGMDGTQTDTGSLMTTIPSDAITERHCSNYVGFWFNESSCVQPITITNIYYHLWISCNSDSGTHIPYLGYDKTKVYLSSFTEFVNIKTLSNRSTIYYDNGNAAYNHTYTLKALFFDTSNQACTDNDIYQFYIRFSKSLEEPSIISNRSFPSFILFNVPSNATLNASYPDSDSDGLSDWYELYRTFSNPFLSDSDNDGATDNDEYTAGTDLNNWTVTPVWSNHNPALSNPSPINGSADLSRYPQLNITVNDADGNVTRVCFWSNATGSWVKAQQNNTVAAGSVVRFMAASFADTNNTRYWWKVTAEDEFFNSSAVYDFSTEIGYYLFDVVISGDSDFNIGNGVRYGTGTLANPYMICNWTIQNLTITGTTLNFTIMNCTFVYHVEIDTLSVNSSLVLDTVRMDGTGKGSLCYIKVVHANTVLSMCVFKDLYYSYFKDA